MIFYVVSGKGESALGAALALINVIVNSPDELRVRVLLRNEFFAMGLDDGLLDSLTALGPRNENLASQLDTFTYLLEDGTLFRLLYYC